MRRVDAETGEVIDTPYTDADLRQAAEDYAQAEEQHRKARKHFEAVGFALGATDFSHVGWRYQLRDKLVCNLTVADLIQLAEEDHPAIRTKTEFWEAKAKELLAQGGETAEAAKRDLMLTQVQFTSITKDTRKGRNNA